MLEHFKIMGSIESGLMGTLGSIFLITFCLTPLICFFCCPKCQKQCIPRICCECFHKRIDNRIFKQNEVDMALALLRNNQPTNAQNQQPTAPTAPFYDSIIVPAPSSFPLNLLFKLLGHYFSLLFSPINFHSFTFQNLT